MIDHQIDGSLEYQRCGMEFGRALGPSTETRFPMRRCCFNIRDALLHGGNGGFRFGSKPPPSALPMTSAPHGFLRTRRCATGFWTGTRPAFLLGALAAALLFAAGCD